MLCHRWQWEQLLVNKGGETSTVRILLQQVAAQTGCIPLQWTHNCMYDEWYHIFSLTYYLPICIVSLMLAIDHPINPFICYKVPKLLSMTFPRNTLSPTVDLLLPTLSLWTETQFHQLWDLGDWGLTHSKALLSFGLVPWEWCLELAGS